MQTEAQGNPKALSSREAVVGMLLMLDPSMVFSEFALRKFLVEQSRWQPDFENLFRTRKTACGDMSDGLDNTLFFLQGLLLADVGPDFKVRRSMRGVFLDQLMQQGILPFYEERFKQEAERFAAAVKAARQQPVRTY